MTAMAWTPPDPKSGAKDMEPSEHSRLNRRLSCRRSLRSLPRIEAYQVKWVRSTRSHGTWDCLTTILTSESLCSKKGFKTHGRGLRRSAKTGQRLRSGDNCRYRHCRHPRPRTAVGRRYLYDHLEYVLYVFSWGEPGTTLAEETSQICGNVMSLSIWGAHMMDTATAIQTIIGGFAVFFLPPRRRGIQDR